MDYSDVGKCVICSEPIEFGNGDVSVTLISDLFIVLDEVRYVHKKCLIKLQEHGSKRQIWK